MCLKALTIRKNEALKLRSEFKKARVCRIRPFLQVYLQLRVDEVTEKRKKLLFLCVIPAYIPACYS